MRLRWIVAAACLGAVEGCPAAGQQCALDPNRNGRTEVNELVMAIGQALEGCPGGQVRTPTPAPHGCPFRFTDDTSDGDFCRYVGDVDGGQCLDEFGITGAWRSIETTVIAIIAIDGESIGLAGTRTSPTTASVDAWSIGPDFDVQLPTTGQIRLPSGDHLTASFNSGASICGTIAYDGEYSGLIAAQRLGEPVPVEALLDRWRAKVVGH